MTPRKLADRMTFLHHVATAHHGTAFRRGLVAGLLALLALVLCVVTGGTASDIFTGLGIVFAAAFVYQFGRTTGLAAMASVVRTLADRDAAAGPLDDDTEWGPYR